MKIIAAVTVAAAIAAHASAYCQDTLSSVRVIRDCGRERWDVKTLRDADTAMVDFAHPKTTTLDSLTRLRGFVPSEYMQRQWCERTVYVVNAYLYGHALNRDRDIQLYLRDPKSGRTVLASIPDPECPEVGATGRATTYRALRQWVRDNAGEPADSLQNPILVRVTGVGIYGSLNNQTAMAENGFEIHPVTGLERIDLLASTGSMPSPSTLKPPVPEKPAVRRVRQYRKVRRHYRRRRYRTHRRYRSRRARRGVLRPVGALIDEPKLKPSAESRTAFHETTSSYTSAGATGKIELYHSGRSRTDT
jgi:hypothetical protein